MSNVAYCANVMTGLDLKVMRVAADVRVKDLAAAMGVTDSRISYLESRRKPTETAIAKYIAALATLTTNPTDARDVA